MFSPETDDRNLKYVKALTCLRRSVFVGIEVCAIVHVCPVFMRVYLGQAAVTRWLPSPSSHAFSGVSLLQRQEGSGLLPGKWDLK